MVCLQFSSAVFTYKYRRVVLGWSYAQPPILTTLYFYIAQLTVHWEILEIHRAGRCYRQSKKVFDVRIGPWRNKLNIKKQDILYTQWKIQICSRNVESRKIRLVRRVQQPEHRTTEHAGLRDTMRHITSVTQQSIDIDRGTRAVIASEHTGYYHKITDDYLEDTNINISSTWAAPVSWQPGSLDTRAPYSY